MISYEKLWETMQIKGISSYMLREQYNMDRRTIRQLKANETITTETLNALCTILDCTIQDIVEYVKE